MRPSKTSVQPLFNGIEESESQNCASMLGHLICRLGRHIRGHIHFALAHGEVVQEVETPNMLLHILQYLDLPKKDSAPKLRGLRLVVSTKHMRRPVGPFA